MPLFFKSPLIFLVFKFHLRIPIQTANQRKRINNNRAKRIAPFQPPIHWNRLPNILFLLFKRKKLSPAPSFPPSQTTDWQAKFWGLRGSLLTHCHFWIIPAKKLLLTSGRLAPSQPPNNLIKIKPKPKN